MFQPTENFTHLLSLRFLTPTASAYLVDWNINRTLAMVDDIPQLPIATSLLFKRESENEPPYYPDKPYFTVTLPSRQPDSPGVNPYPAVLSMVPVWEQRDWEVSIVHRQKQQAIRDFAFNAGQYRVELPKSYVDKQINFQDATGTALYVHFRYSLPLGEVKQKAYRVLQQPQPQPPSFETYIDRWREFETHGSIRWESPSAETLEVFYLLDETPVMTQHVDVTGKWTDYVLATPFLDKKSVERAVGSRGELIARANMLNRRQR